MKYLRKFATEAEYQSAKKSEGFITPNISLIYVSGGSSNWVEGVAENGTFVKLANTSIPTGINGIPEGWTVENI